MDLLEREAPLAILRASVDAARSEGGRLAFVEGEAGVGKTSLLGAFRRALPVDVRSVQGACDPLSTPQPFGPLIEFALDLDPTLARALDQHPTSGTIARAFLATLQSSPLVIVLDDLHWADEATLDVLRFVGRRMESTSTLIVGAYRDDEVGTDHPLRMVLGELASSTRVQRIRLEGLSPEAVARLAEHTDLDPAELHARTNGNPFFVTEVVAGAPASIPQTVRDAVLARVGRLSATGRRTLEAAAVIGLSVEPRLLGQVVGDTASAECLSSGLLQANAGLYVFRHEIARQAVLDATDPSTFVSLHERVLAALMSEGRQRWPVARLAHHAVAAGDGQRALGFGRQAAQEASQAGAHREAAAQLAKIEPYSGLLPARERGTYFEHLAREQFLTARPDLGLGAFERATAAWHEAGDPLEEIRILTEAAKSYVGSGRIADAYALAERAETMSRELPDPLVRAEALNVLAYVTFQDRDPAAIGHARRAIELAGSDVRGAATALMAWNTIGSARIHAGDRGGIADLQRSLEMAMERGMDRGVAHAYANLVESLGATFRFEDADPNFDAGLRYVIDRELDAQRTYIEAWLAVTEMYRGRWAASADRARRIAHDRTNPTISRIVALVALGRGLARRGDREARGVLDEASTLAGPTEAFQFVGPVSAARAELAWLEGDEHRAAAEAESAFRFRLVERHPWIHDELGWWRGIGRPHGTSTRPTTRPWRLQAEGRWREAATAWRHLDCGFEAARALLGSPDPDDVEQARLVFDRLEARPAIGLAVRRLRQLGVRRIARGVRPSTRANAAGLTTREVEVLGLIAGGLTNDQIAARLFLSPRTVHHHVAAVLGKLGVNRRRAAAEAAIKLGLELQHVPARRI